MHHSSQRGKFIREAPVQLWYAFEREPFQFANGPLFTCFSSQWFVCFHLHQGARQTGINPAVSKFGVSSREQRETSLGVPGTCTSQATHSWLASSFLTVGQWIPKKQNPPFLPLRAGQRKDWGLWILPLASCPPLPTNSPYHNCRNPSKLGKRWLGTGTFKRAFLNALHSNCHARLLAEG